MRRIRLAGRRTVPLVGLTACRSPLLESDFENDPRAAGWRTGVFGDSHATFVGNWGETDAARGRRCLTVHFGMWESPALAVEPFAYYRVRFAYRAAEPAFRVVRFFDAANRELPADDHNAVDASSGWTHGEFFTQAREGTVTLRVGFGAGGDDLSIDEVRITRAAPGEVLTAADQLYRTLPPVASALDPDRWKQVPRTMRLLRDRQAVRLLLLGDSIANDIGNALFDLQIARTYPGAQITLLRSILSGKGCTFYRDRVKEYIVDKEPDLVIIAGISHKNDAAAMRSVAEQARRSMRNPVEFLVLTGACNEPGKNRSRKGRGLDSPPPAAPEPAVAPEAQFYAELVRVRDDIPWATLDMRTLWEDYLKDSPQPRCWYQRDAVHANSRGRQILGRILAQFFQPAKE